jgi:hypothetical protein
MSIAQPDRMKKAIIFKDITKIKIRTLMLINMWKDALI